MYRRTPYFLRPRPPRDWRYFVGGFGRTLIVIGLMMFAFVAYQLWGTGIQTARAQRVLKREFNAQLATTTTSTTTVATTTSVPTTSGTTNSSATTTTAPVSFSPNAREGAPIARMLIPRIDVDYLVVQGVQPRDLQKGPGHFPETPLPGQFGNAAIACHRTTYGAPCYDLDHLAAGDRIEFTTLTGNYVYEVTDQVVVSPKDYADVIPTRDQAKATLSLATCTPIGTSKNRLVVHAVLKPELSGQVFIPAASTSSTSTTPGTSIPGTSTAGSTTPPTASTLPPDSAPGTTTPAGGVTDSSASTGDAAFSQGWFSNRHALDQAVLWLGILSVVVVGAYRIGRARRRLWVCFAVGTVPFFVVLYFFFENLNLLLPGSI